MYNTHNINPFFLEESSVTVQIPVYSKQNRHEVRYVSPVKVFVPEASSAKAIAKAVIARAMTETVVTPVFGSSDRSYIHVTTAQERHLHDHLCTDMSDRHWHQRCGEGNHRNKRCGLRNRRVSIKQIIRAQMELH